MALRVENQGQLHDLVALYPTPAASPATQLAGLTATQAQSQRIAARVQGTQAQAQAQKHIGVVPNNGGIDPGVHGDPAAGLKTGIGVAITAAEVAAAIAKVFGPKAAAANAGHTSAPGGATSPWPTSSGQPTLAPTTSSPLAPTLTGGNQPTLSPTSPGIGQMPYPSSTGANQPTPFSPTSPGIGGMPYPSGSGVNAPLMPTQPGSSSVSPADSGGMPSGGALPASTGALPGSGANFHITTYNGLGAKKQPILQALSNAGATPQERDLIMAIGMQETTTLDISMRDGGKDGSNSQNASIFNLNADMLRKLGYTGNPSALNDPSQMQTVVNLMVKGIRQWGTKPFLDYVRGGDTGFKDGSSYDCAGYCKAIGTIMQQFEQDPSLLTDDRRVEINVGHQ